jgi:hypothetical protein
MATIVDGLGFEELGGPGDTGSKSLAQLWITGSVVSQSRITAADTISGAADIYGAPVIGVTYVSGANVYGTGSVVGGRINDGNGALFSNNVGSPASYSAKVQAGVVTTAGGSGGTIEFGTQFASTAYHVAFSVSGAASAILPTVSGAKNVSGCEVIGAASTTYDYIAAGV